jgi:hypothetical protein
VKITIEGEIGEGKTTASAIVEKALREAGYLVQVLEGPTPSGPLGPLVQKHLAARRAMVQDNVGKAVTQKGRRITVFVDNRNPRYYPPPDGDQRDLPPELRSERPAAGEWPPNEGAQPAFRADQDCG